MNPGKIYGALQTDDRFIFVNNFNNYALLD